MTYPPVPPVPETPQPDVNRQKAGLFQAGKWAIWVWVVVTLVPVILLLMCCVGIPLLGAIGGAVDP